MISINNTINRQKELDEWKGIKVPLSKQLVIDISIIELIHGIIYLFISIVLITWGVYEIDECITLIVPSWFVATGCISTYSCLILIIRFILIKYKFLDPTSFHQQEIHNILRFQLSNVFQFILILLVISSLIVLTTLLGILLAFNLDISNNCYGKSFILLLSLFSFTSINASLCFCFIN